MNPATEHRAVLDDEAPSLSAYRDGTVLVGTYQIVRRIGSGGSGHVFEVEHLRLGKHFALKLLRTDTTSRKASQRFRREARAVARLRSEHIVSIVDCGELEDATPYLVMELLEGEDLRRLLAREGALPARRAARIALDACRGLSVVHAAGLVHRDLKPENLFITRRATGEDSCKVLDFGVVKMESSLSTTEGAIVGTVRYMAPEQLMDAAAVGAAADIYALGAILYECLLGRPLTSGTTVQQLMYGVINVTPQSLRTELPKLPTSLTDLVERCISKNAEKRPHSVDYVASILEQFLGRDVTTVAAANTTDEHASAIVVHQAATQPSKRGSYAALGSTLLLGACLGWLTRNPAEASKESVHITPPPAPPKAVEVAATPVRAPSVATLAPLPMASDSVLRGDGNAQPHRVNVPRRPLSAANGSAPVNAAPRGPSSTFDSSNPYQD